jgi:hypothetical protein
VCGHGAPLASPHMHACSAQVFLQAFTCMGLALPLVSTAVPKVRVRVKIMGLIMIRTD